jgi:hypothetical protein
MASAVLGNPGFGLGTRAVIYGDLVTATSDEVSCHGKAHYPEADERDFAH